MSNVIDMSDAIESKLKKHLDLADIWLETGDELAYDDHMKIAESLMVRLDELQVHNQTK